MSDAYVAHEKVGNRTYMLSFSISEFNHLCSFRELSNIEFSYKEKDTRFDDYTYEKYNFSRQDFDIFRYMFIQALQGEYSETWDISSSVIGLLLTYHTGTAARWDYLDFSHERLQPFLSKLPIYSTTVLYSRFLDDPEYGYGDDDGLEELTQANLHLEDLYNFDTSDTIAYITEANAAIEEKKEPELTLPTKTAIEEFLGTL